MASLTASSVKPGLHEPQLPVERSVTSVSSIVVDRRYYAPMRASSQQRRSTAREQKKVTLHSTCCFGSGKPGFTQALCKVIIFN